MKKLILSSVFIGLIIFSGFAQGDKKKLTAADYDQAAKFLGANTNKLVDRASVNPNWLPDGRMWYSVSVGSGKEFVLINPADGSRKTAPDKKTLLEGIADDKESAAGGGRRNFSNDVISPDGKKAAFIRDWNLWVKDIETKKETQLTTDGVKDFGYATDNAGWKKSDRAILLWSPDSKKIATFQQDQRNVSDMYLVTTNVGTPKLEAWKYPLPVERTSSAFSV